MRGRTLDRALTLDARSLGIARILIGFLLLVDLAYRAADLSVFYTDNGVLPRAVLDHGAWGYVYSFHHLSGSTGWALSLFLLQTLAAIFFLVGFHTRLATVACALLYGSLVARNPLLQDVQDDLVRVLLFWSVFLPMGRRYSIDRLQLREYGGDGVLSVASAAFLVQIALIDWVGAIAKLQSPWWRSGDGTFYALSLGRYQTPLAHFFLDRPGLLSVANYAAILLELVVPVFLFMPRFRRRAAWVLIAVHGTDAIFLELGIYPFLVAAALVALLPEKEAEDDPISSPLAGALATAAISLVFLLNVPSVFPGATVPRSASQLGSALGLTQSWALFAPHEITQSVQSDYWFVVASDATDARAFERPNRIAATLKNHRWRQYFANLRYTHPADSAHAKTVEGSRSAYLRYLCEDTSAARLRLVYLNQKLGMPESAPKRVDLAEVDCNAGSED